MIVQGLMSSGWRSSPSNEPHFVLQTRIAASCEGMQMLFMFGLALS